MRKLTPLLFLLLFSTGCVFRGGGGRRDVLINDGWRFTRSDVPRGQTVALNDSKWQKVTLPHTWNNLDGQDGGSDYYRGPGWYRRKLTIDKEDLRKSIFLRFDGASIVTNVYVNGLPAGEHRGAFGAFCFEITNLLRPGKNLIAVRVDNARDQDIPPWSGDWTMCGGLYRNVHLLTLSPLSISPMDDASPGVYLRQTRVRRESAEIEILTKLRSAYATEQTVTVQARIEDARGKTVASTFDQVEVKSDTDSRSQVTISNPHLWDGVRDPYMYRAIVEVTRGKTVLDRVTQPLGIRFYSVDPENGFALNDRHYDLHGVNVHQDYWNMGGAITPKQITTNYNFMKELGVTVVRMCHYQHPDFEYAECDRRGLVVWAELANVNRIHPTKAFADNAKQQLRELIKQNYNHPSICFWSLYNELNFSSKDPENWKLISELNDLAHELDGTRLTTAATNRDTDHPVNWIPDITAFNRYWGWYSGTLDDWGPKMDEHHVANPTRAIAVSEYGAGASVKQHEVYPTDHPKPTGAWHPEEWQAIFHENVYRALRTRQWLWGTFIWVMFDFAADQRKEGDYMGRNDKGLVTADRKIRKDAFYFYKAHWNPEPFVYITSRRFNPRPPGMTTLKVYSNCEVVELFLNGKSLGRRSSANHVFVWMNVNLPIGKVEVRALGDRQGKRYKDSVKWRISTDAQMPPPTTQPATNP